MTDPPISPAKKLEIQAERCRSAWRLLNPTKESQLLTRLQSDRSSWATVWISIIKRQHSFAEWLDSEDPLDAIIRSSDEVPSVRQIISSHPFSDTHPWFNLPMFQKSC